MSRWLFAPEPGSYLAVLRFTLIMFIVLFRLPERFFLFDWSNSLPPEFMNKGFWLSLSPIPVPLPNDWVTGYYLLVKNLGLAAAFGLFGRISLIGFTLCYGHMVALESAWGWHDHGPSLVIQVLLIMCVAPGVTAISIDSVISAWWKRKLSWPAIFNSQIPRFAMQLCLVLVILFYMSAGVSKLRYGGLNWLDGKTLSFYLSGKSKSNQIQQFGAIDNPSDSLTWKDGVALSHYLYGAKPSQFGIWFSKQSFLCSVAAISTVVLELIAPIALFGGWIRRIFFLSTAAFHIGIYFLMGIPFITWVILDCVFAWYSPRKPSG